MTTDLDQITQHVHELLISSFPRVDISIVFTTSLGRHFYFDYRKLYFYEDHTAVFAPTYLSDGPRHRNLTTFESQQEFKYADPNFPQNLADWLGDNTIE